MATTPIPGVNGAWSLYRQCAMTSRLEKSRLETLLKVSLYLGIFGAVLGTVTSVMAEKDSSVSKILGVVGGVAVAMAGVAATQATSGDRQKIWLKCRAGGESLKSAVYLYSAGAPPFDGPDRASKLADLAEKVMQDVGGIPLRPSDGKLPPGPMTVTDYILGRVDTQIAFYTNTAAEFEKKADFWKYCALSGAALSAILGAISTVAPITPWVALLATLTTSITAFVNNQRYESMISLYQTTATRLRLLKDQWSDGGKSDADKAQRGAFMQRCEETMASENGAWLAQWSQAAPAPSQSPAEAAADPPVEAPATPPAAEAAKPEAAKTDASTPDNATVDHKGLSATEL
jgi:hypothetical protein